MLGALTVALAFGPYACVCNGSGAGVIVTLESSGVAHVSRDVAPGATFIGLAPIRMPEPPPGVVPTTTEASAVRPVDEVAVAVYRVGVPGATFILPLVAPAGAPLMVTETTPLLLLLSGASASAGLVGVEDKASRVSTSFAPPNPFTLR